MKLQIKTLARKQLVIDIDEKQSVYDLKRELSLYPDVGVAPELQKLIYSGKVLRNDDELSTYEIDVKKFLVVMTLKKPETESPATPSTSIPVKEEQQAAAAAAADSATTTPTTTTTTTSTNASTPTTPATPAVTNATGAASDAETAQLIAQITGMGYAEADVRRALAASFNNAERAVEYLIDGMPTRSTENATNDDDMWIDIDDEEEPLTVFRRDPLFNALRDAVMQDPALMDDVIQRISADNPALLEMVNENRGVFLRALLETTSGDDDDDDEDSEDSETAV